MLHCNEHQRSFYFAQDVNLLTVNMNEHFVPRMLLEENQPHMDIIL